MAAFFIALQVKNIPLEHRTLLANLLNGLQIVGRKLDLWNGQVGGQVTGRGGAHNGCRYTRLMQHPGHSYLGQADTMGLTHPVQYL